MRLASIAVALMGIGLASAAERTASIYVQPITTSGPSSSNGNKANPAPAPLLLAEVRYQTPVPTRPESDSSELVSYEAPDLPRDTKLLRVGVYDPASSRWLSSTSVASTENFGKGYAPHFVVTVGGGEQEEEAVVLGVSVRGVRIDAGHTRDFGPQVVVVPAARGKQPDLNKPVVLSPEGRKVVEEVEKSFLQKYWWVLAIGAVLVMTGGGEGK